MTASVRIAFVPYSVGWAVCELTVDGASHRMAAVSDTTDALGDLVRAALMIATGASRATASFDAEPVETRWVLETAWVEDERWENGFRIRLLEFEDIHCEQPETQGDLVFSTLTDADAFARAVLAEAERLMQPKNTSWLTGDNAPLLTSATRALRAALG